MRRSVASACVRCAPVLGLTPVLVPALMLAAFLAGCGRAHPPTEPPIPPKLLAEARPVGRGSRFQPPVSGSIVGPCRAPIGARYGVHVELFGANRVVIIPGGIGARQPLTTTLGRVTRARCFGSLVTIDPTGLVLVRPGARPRLGDLFRAWGEPLSARRAATFSAARSDRVEVFVDGRRWRQRPASVPLRRHAEIVVEVGPHVPPHNSYTFPLGL